MTRSASTEKSSEGPVTRSGGLKRAHSEVSASKSVSFAPPPTPDLDTSNDTSNDTLDTSGDSSFFPEQDKAKDSDKQDDELPPPPKRARVSNGHPVAIRVSPPSDTVTLPPPIYPTGSSGYVVYNPPPAQNGPPTGCHKHTFTINNFPNGYDIIMGPNGELLYHNTQSGERHAYHPSTPHPPLPLALPAPSIPEIPHADLTAMSDRLDRHNRTLNELVTVTKSIQGRLQVHEAGFIANKKCSDDWQKAFTNLYDHTHRQISSFDTRLKLMENQRNAHNLFVGHPGTQNGAFHPADFLHSPIQGNDQDLGHQAFGDAGHYDQ